MITGPILERACEAYRTLTSPMPIYCDREAMSAALEAVEDAIVGEATANANSGFNARTRQIIAALDAHDAQWAHRHISKRPLVPLSVRQAIDNAR